MAVSLILVPLIGFIIAVGILIAVVVGILLHRVFRGRPSFTDTTAAVVSAAIGFAAFVAWCVLAGSVLFLLATISINRM